VYYYKTNIFVTKIHDRNRTLTVNLEVTAHAPSQLNPFHPKDSVGFFHPRTDSQVAVFNVAHLQNQFDFPFMSLNLHFPLHPFFSLCNVYWGIWVLALSYLQALLSAHWWSCLICASVLSVSYNFIWIKKLDQVQVQSLAWLSRRWGSFSSEAHIIWSLLFLVLAFNA
jgi:hypothetical protein